MLKINCNGKRTVGKANKGINVGKNNRFKKLKIKIEKRGKKWERKTPVDDPHAKVGIKPQLKPRGSEAKKKDSKHSHQLYKLQIKATQPTK